MDPVISGNDANSTQNQTAYNNDYGIAAEAAALTAKAFRMMVDAVGIEPA
jgi:hypothetical protein